MLKLFLCAVAALCVKGSDVITLTNDNFEEKTKALTGDGGIWFVEFYATDCSHCEIVAPYWEELATELKGKVNVAKVDCRDEANAPLAFRFEIKHFPTFYLIANGMAHATMPGPQPKKALLQFLDDGGAGFHHSHSYPVPPVKYMEDVPPQPELPPPHTGPSDVVTLTDDDFEHLTQASSGSTTGDWLIAFHSPSCDHCLFLAPVWEELATDLKEQTVVARVDITENQIVARRFNIKSYPTVIFISKGEMTTFRFKGSRNKDDMLNFIAAFSESEDKVIVPRDFTQMEVIQEWLESSYERHKRFTFKRLAFAERDFMEGKYWSIHIVVVVSVFLAIMAFLSVLYVIISPAKKSKESRSTSAQSKKTD